MNDVASPQPWIIRDLGRQGFLRVWPAMERFTDTRADDAIDELWLVEHNPVFTLGQAGKPEHVLAPGDIPVIQTNRGGQVTYHGPGQIVAYPLVDLRRIGIGVREFVCRIEQAMIDTMARQTPALDDADILEDAGDVEGDPAGDIGDLPAHRQCCRDDAEGDLALLPQRDGDDAEAG